MVSSPAMIFKPVLALMTMGTACTLALTFWVRKPSSTANAERPATTALPLPLQHRQERIETAVVGFFSAKNAQERSAFIQRSHFVDAKLETFAGEVLEVDEVGELNKGDTTLTIVRARVAER